MISFLLGFALVPQVDGAGSASEAGVAVTDAASLLAALNDTSTTTVRLASKVVLLGPVASPIAIKRVVELVGPLGGSISAVLNFQHVGSPMIVIHGNGSLALSSVVIVNGSAGERCVLLRIQQ